MTYRDQLRALILDLAVVRGRVTLSSGAEADWYLDLRRLSLHHAGAPLIGRVMLDVTEDWSYEAMGGLTSGEAFEHGVSVRAVWNALCNAMDVPESSRWEIPMQQRRS